MDQRLPLADETPLNLLGTKDEHDYGATTGLAQPASTSTDAPPRKISWQGTSWLMLTDIVGTSVLTFAGVAGQLGYVPTVILILACNPVAIYTATLMSRTRSMLAACAGIEPTSMGEAARYTLGGARVAMAMYALVYGMGFLGNASYLLTMGQSLQGTLYNYGVCLPTAVLLSCLICLPLCVSVRHLSESVTLCFFNLFLILAVLGIVFCKLISDGRPADTETFMVAPDLNFLTLLRAATNVIYSYTGHWLYFELMAEMQEPEDFPKVFIINAPLQVGLYLSVACLGYHFTGSNAKGYLLDNLALGPAFRVASALLFLHVVVAFLIKSVVVARFVHRLVSPDRVGIDLREAGGVRAHLEYAACSVALLVAAFFIANAIPFFDDLLGLIGGFFSGPISFIFPIMFFAGAQQYATLTNTKGAMTRADRLVFPLIVSLTLLTMVVGTYSVVQDIMSRSQALGPPFSCKLLSRG